MQRFLTDDEVLKYETEGFLVLKNWFDDSTVAELRNEAFNLLKNENLLKSTSIFTTNEQNRSTDDYFLKSGREISFFWEEKAFNNGVFNSNLDVFKAINKIGHGLHDLNPVFERISYDSKIASICKDLGMSKPLAAQSMYIFKQAVVGGEVGAHQDGAFIFTEPQSVIGFWWALDDCTINNGCLYAIPGSHKMNVTRRFCRNLDRGYGTVFIPPESPNWDLSKAVPLEVGRGTLVIIHGALIHFSNENISENARHAYSVHVIEGKEGFTYPNLNWLQRPETHPFREIV